MERLPTDTAPECEPLLGTDNQRSQHPEQHEEHHEDDSVDGTATIGNSKLKLAATVFDFFTIGLGVAGIGVCVQPRSRGLLFLLTGQGLDTRSRQSIRQSTMLQSTSYLTRID